MSGIKDLLAFQYWLNNEKKPELEAVISNRKKISKEKEEILQDLRSAGNESPGNTQSSAQHNTLKT